MRESQVHQAFSKWLDKHGIPFVHSRTDRKTSTRCGDCDYYVFWMSHVVAIEIKTGRNKLSPDQEKRIAYIRRAGNKVVIAYSVEECIEATKNVLCVGKTDLSGGESRQVQHGLSTRTGSQAETLPVESSARFSNSPAQNSLPAASDAKDSGAVQLREPECSGQPLFIGKITGTDYVLRGDGSPGGQCEMVRRATPADLLNLKLR